MTIQRWSINTAKLFDRIRAEVEQKSRAEATKRLKGAHVDEWEDYRDEAMRSLSDEISRSHGVSEADIPLVRKRLSELSELRRLQTRMF